MSDRLCCASEASVDPIEPNVFRYLDYRVFLSEWFAWKKATEKRYSHRAFVAQTGQRSPSLLSDVIAGRRNLTTAGIEGFLRALSYTGERGRFFRLLVSLDQAETPAERNSALVDITAHRRFRDARQLEGDGFRYLSTWYIPVVRELANREGFREDPAWIASQVRPAITPAQAAEALEVLFDLDLLVRTDEGVTFGGGSVVTPREVGGLPVHNYHQGMLDRAKDAIQDVDPEERHFLAVTVTAPHALLPQLRDELGAFQERILELCAGTDLPAEQVLQFNLHFFPLSTAGELS